MAKIGSYDFPDTKFRTVLKATETLIETLNGKVTEEKNFAEAIGHDNIKSGGYLQKVSDMRKYGLITKRGVEATELAKKIIRPLSSEEKEQAIRTAVNNIKLWKDIHSKVGDKTLDETQFRIVLSELTGDRDKSFKLSNSIRLSYKEISHYFEGNPADESENYLSNETDNNLAEKQKENKPKDKNKSKLQENMISASSGEVLIEMPKDKRYLKVVENLMNNLKLQLELEEENEDNSESEEKK